MSFADITDRVYQLGSAWEQFKQVNDTRLREIEKKGYADPLHNEQLTKLSSALDQHKSRVDQLETAWQRPLTGGQEKMAAPFAGEYKKAFTSYLRKGMDASLEALQTKSLSVGSNADGGYLVTDAMTDMIVRIVNESSPMRSLASIETISSDALDVIEDTNDMNASWVAETDTRPETTTAQIGRHQILVYELYAQPKATQKLVDDSSIDIEQWIATKVADKFARLESTAFISGNGTTQPKGILSYTAGTAWGQIQQIGSGTSATVTADSLISLYYGLKQDYARNATFLMNRATIQSVRLLKGTTNQYLWQPGLAAGAPDTLLGAPVAMAADMPVPAAASLSVAIADFKRAYLIVDRVGVRILRDPFTNKPFIMFYTTKRVGGEVVNYDAIKLLKLS